jgi:hypothetical protein
MNIINTHSESIQFFHADWQVDTETTTAYFFAFFERNKITIYAQNRKSIQHNKYMRRKN